MCSRCCYCVAYHFGGNARSLVSESGTYPGTRPGVAHIFRIGIACYPKRAPVFRFGIKNAAAPRRHKLWGAWLLSVIVPVCNLSGASVETV